MNIYIYRILYIWHIHKLVYYKLRRIYIYICVYIYIYKCCSLCGLYRKLISCKNFFLVVRITFPIYLDNNNQPTHDHSTRLMPKNNNRKQKKDTNITQTRKRKKKRRRK